ncbi:MAG: hypothetical protein K1Y01_08990 [Vicinamibacteria bacterium]|nr:hypothetical protein [Vicinamibacteria bacterium]
MTTQPIAPPPDVKGWRFADEPPARAPFVEPSISEPGELIAGAGGLLQQSSSGGTLDGGPGPSDGGLD